MRFLFFLLALVLVFPLRSSAEGTRELAPNGSIMIDTNATTDLAALHINNPAFNSFASFLNADPHSRLYIHIKDPAKECMYLGFSFGHLNVTSPNPTRVDYQYRVKDPAGNIVFGPVIIQQNAANIQNWSQAFTGPMQIHGAGGYNAHQVTSASLASQGWTGAGDYYIEFERIGVVADLLIDFWDITVADCSTAPVAEKKGRVWSYNWSIFAVNDFGFPNRPFNGAFYVCAPDPDDTDAAFITKIDFNGSGFTPAAFNVAFNSFGINNTGNISEDRKSVELNNATQSEYAIFLNDPVELCKTAVVGEIELAGIGRCDAGDYCIRFTTTKEGQIDLLLDFDGNDGIFTSGTRDVLIPHFVTADEVGIPSCISWSGLDGLNNPLPEVAGTQIPVIISYAQGIYHFPIYDAERMTIGFMLEAVRPSASIPLLHYDDSNISVASGSGEPDVQISGCTVPCHRWTQFVNNNIPGFGNLHTINSWWFSQRIIREDVLLLPAYYSCEVDGPQNICAGGTTQISFSPQVHPAGVTGPEMISTIWTGPGIIGSNQGNTITIGSAGSYHVEVKWLSGVGDTCNASCDYQLATDPPLTGNMDTLILQGEVLDINGELYSEGGVYVQELNTSNGCDSILTITIKVINTVIYYDLNDCISFMSDGTNMDYAEFTAEIPQPLSCADISAGILFRDPPQMNKHSCTGGVGNSIAMCISAQDTCAYDPGSDASLVFAVTVAPDPDTAVQLTSFTFFDKAPLVYSWIGGASGPNNYPTLFGLRILKNGVEIYRDEAIITKTDWEERVFNFEGIEEFIVIGPTTFRFELLPYCLSGNGIDVAAWDIDDVRVMASCVSPAALDKIIAGTVRTPKGKLVPGVKMTLTTDPEAQTGRVVTTDINGHYIFGDNRFGEAYYITGYNNTDFKNGVSTMDLIQLQRHLLGINLFDSPYKFIAADADRSNTISALDLIALRKLILNIEPTLPNNTSWRFGNADTSLYPGLPWGFKETIEIENLSTDIDNADFVGVKVGDINGTVELFNSPVIANRNAQQPLHFTMTETSTNGGLLVQVDFASENFNEVAGFQFAVQLNDASIQQIISGKLKLTSEHYNVSDGKLIVSWINPESVTVDKGEVLFSIILTPGQKSKIPDFLKLDPDFMHAEAYTGEMLETRDIKFGHTASAIVMQGNYLLQNDPNPFSDKTNIRFHIAQDGEVILQLFDASGRLLKEIKQHYLPGVHVVEISKDEIGVHEGILFCHLITSEGSGMVKMILMGPK